MANKFTQLNCAACFLATAILALTIAAAALNWYQYEEEYQASTVDTTATPGKDTINYTRVYWSLEGATVEARSTQAQSETSTFSEYDSNDAAFKIIKIAQAFTLIALIISAILALILALVFVDAIRNKLLFIAGMTVIRMALVFLGLIVVISLVTAFLGLLGINDAFSDDIPSCQMGYCRRFRDTVDDDLGVQTFTDQTGTSVTRFVTRSVSWGPDAGWYIVLACIPLAVFLALLLIVNKFPIPVDSVTIGEAL